MRQSRPPESAAVLARLKDFQRETVERVFDRLYGSNATNRFLVADEVGLGKTLVARGVIAKAIERLWPTTPRIDVIYICSNADIARQNINRLNVMGDDVVRATRLTLLPVEMHDLTARRVNFISMTPSTSLEPLQSMGIARERALLYWLLKDVWSLHGAAPRNLLTGLSESVNFQWYINNCPVDQINKGLAARFATSVRRGSLRRRFESLLQEFPRARQHWRYPLEIRQERTQMVAALRSELAKCCVDALEPDLIILDEFQRFKHLLDSDDEDSELAQQLFQYADKHTTAKVLLLSATPYKMCTLNCEAGENHYQDFIQTVRFLQDDGDQTERFVGLLDSFRREVFMLGQGSGHGRLVGIKHQIENALRQVMVRTERLSVSPDRNGMLREAAAPDLQVRAHDLRGYVTLRRVAETVDHPDVIEYWKSAPYLLNFMESYQFKQRFKDNCDSEDLVECLLRDPSVLLKWADVHRYRPLDPSNARLRWLLDETVASGLWRLLWLPPSLPYYAPSGPFADPSCCHASKYLVFSAWQVVPKVVASMLSYETERLAFATEDAPTYSREFRERRGQLLQFARSEGRLTGMPVFTLIYPCQTLERAVDPLHLRPGATDELSLQQALATVKHALAPALDALIEKHGHSSSGREDETWYWAAPVLLDLDRHAASTRAWWGREELPALWTQRDGVASDQAQGSSRWVDHVERVRELLAGKIQLGRPPTDLLDVLALMALAAPGVTALRALRRLIAAGSRAPVTLMLEEAARVGWSFRSLLNMPETTAIVQATRDGDEPYWLKVLRYCAAGNLQAVLDEYCHVLPDYTGSAGQTPAEIIDQVGEAICGALSIRTSTVTVDQIHVNRAAMRADLASNRMRTRFAMRFGEATKGDGDDTARPAQVRTAFNSPFWPFVLATTSVGQEGLDFHLYCHKVVHWNLPPNPVDLEQREGRVHRYKGHAVRKNVAQRWGQHVRGNGTQEPWAEMFAAALADKPADSTEIIPYWVYTAEDGSGAVIERHVPTLPFSREQGRLTALRRSLAVYRMVFGQTRQEDLIAYLTEHVPEDDLKKLAEDLRVDLTP